MSLEPAAVPTMAGTGRLASGDAAWRLLVAAVACAGLIAFGLWWRIAGVPVVDEPDDLHAFVFGRRQYRIYGDASFERGLTFTETITDWVPLQRIEFTIRANTATIPRTTLDEHVTVGGRFFVPAPWLP